MKRHKHSLSHYKLATLSMGELVPVGVFEVLPGDSVQQATSVLLRVSPLLSPVMHPVQVRMHHWFVPNRLLWSNWESFITGGSDGNDASVPPYIETGGGGISAGSPLEYMGVPPGVADLEVSALPLRAYNLIYNEYYRDQDLVTAVSIGTGDGADATTPNTMLKIAWEKDYFTSARPWTQKGDEVTVPIGDTAPVVNDGTTPTLVIESTHRNMQALDATTRLGFSGSAVTGDQDVTRWGNNTGLEADLSQATGVSINELREAFALQRYKEARAAYGSRYTEYLRYLGLRPLDARLQRPEYLGGGKQTIAFSEVLQTGTDFDANDGVGTMRGHGIAAMRSRRYRRFFEEHGIVISLMSVRPKAMYENALHRMWSRTTKEDYWQKELEHIGQQEVYRREIYAEADNSGAGGDAVFGYNDRYADYRHLPSTVAADFRSTLNMWHLARDLSAAPTLNQSFIECDPATRIFASAATDTLWCMINHSIQARRMVTKSAVGRIR